MSEQVDEKGARGSTIDRSKLGGSLCNLTAMTEFCYRASRERGAEWLGAVRYVGNKAVGQFILTTT